MPDSVVKPLRRGWRARPGRSLVAGVLLAALLSSLSVTLVTRLWDLPLRVRFSTRIRSVMIKKTPRST